MPSIREKRVHGRLIAIVDPAFEQQPVAYRIDQQAFDLGGSAVAS